MDDERKEVLTEIIEFLRSQYVQYGRAIGYLEQLAGIRAMPRKPPEQLHFLLVPQAGIQRGAIVLGNLEPHTLHTMRVTFHRYHWYLEVEYGGCDNWKHGKITCAMPLCRAQLVPCNYKKNLKKIQRVLKNNPLYQRLRVLNDQLFLGSASTFRLWELNFNLGCCGCQWLTMLILWPRRWRRRWCQWKNLSNEILGFTVYPRWNLKRPQTTFFVFFQNN